MTSPSVILRKWTGRIRTAQQDEYVAYIAGTGIEDYAKTPGNLGFQMLLRELEGAALRSLSCAPHHYSNSGTSRDRPRYQTLVGHYESVARHRTAVRQRNQCGCRS